MKMFEATRRNSPTSDHPRNQKKQAKLNIKTPETAALETNFAFDEKRKYVTRTMLATMTIIE